MAPHTRALTRAARERVRHTGERFQDARIALEAERAQADVPTPQAAVARVVRDGDRWLLTLTSTADGFTGWTRALPLPHVPTRTAVAAGSTPYDHVVADRILAEARWVRDDDWGTALLADGHRAPVRRTASVAEARAVREASFTPPQFDRPCRCSTFALTGSPCLHGTTCAATAHPDDPECEGRLEHIERYPGSHWGVTTWEDRYVCAGCNLETYRYGDLDGLPWGYHVQKDGARAMVVHEGVDHPAYNAAGAADGCGECGASTNYDCNCSRRCIECGADDAYGCDCAELDEAGV